MQQHIWNGFHNNPSLLSMAQQHISNDELYFSRETDECCYDVCYTMFILKNRSKHKNSIETPHVHHNILNHAGWVPVKNPLLTYLNLLQTVITCSFPDITSNWSWWEGFKCANLWMLVATAGCSTSWNLLCHAASFDPQNCLSWWFRNGTNLPSTRSTSWFFLHF